MKTKQKLIGASLLLVGAGSLAVLLGLTVKGYLDDQNEERTKQAIRDFFTPFGEIAVLYINHFESDKDRTKGGLVMTDGRIYQFVYCDGEINYTREQ